MKWVDFITNGNRERITEKYNLKFLDAKEESAEVTFDSVDIKGLDGVLPGLVTFNPFKLVLRFSYRGVDNKNLELFKTKIRGVFYKRTPFYIVHSDLPGKKYAVVSNTSTPEDITHYMSVFEVTFTVYKGFSESVNTSDEEFEFDSDWMFENGIPMNITPKYHHQTNQFTIWNGSTDTIDPRMKHELKILLNIDAKDGFEIVNYTTDDVFKYKKSIDKDIDFVLDGVYAYRDMNRVGIDTNRGVLTLAPGKNEIRVKGDVSNINVVFKFPFIYR